MIGVAYHNADWEDKLKLVPKNYCEPDWENFGPPFKPGDTKNFMRNLLMPEDTWSICNRCDLLHFYQTEMKKHGRFCLAE